MPVQASFVTPISYAAPSYGNINAAAANNAAPVFPFSQQTVLVLAAAALVVYLMVKKKGSG